MFSFIKNFEPGGADDLLGLRLGVSLSTDPLTDELSDVR
jgi:hypothetical protein